MSDLLETVLLPDLPAIWRTQYAENPLATPALIEAADEWVKANVPFDPRTVDAYIACNFGLFASLAYAHLDDVAHVRSTIEQMHLYFVIDEFTDEEDAPTVKRICDQVMYALRHPHVLIQDETCLGKLTREFWSRMLDDADCTDSSAERYIVHFQEYLDCTYQQAVDRGNKKLRAYDEYMQIRRPGSGAHPSIDLLLAKHDIPDAVYNGVFVQKLLSLTIDLVVIMNIRVLYRELASSDPHHNLVQVFKFDRDLATYQDALNGVGTMFDSLTKEYRELSNASLNEYPESIAAVLRKLLSELDVSIAGQIEWFFRSRRYFGQNGERVKRDRSVELRVESVPSISPSLLHRMGATSGSQS